MVEPHFIDYVAKRIREAYGVSVGGQMLDHIQTSPWEGLPWERKYKWREMAETALALAEEEWFDPEL
jgi:hypothetical protein